MKKKLVLAQILFCLFLVNLVKAQNIELWSGEADNDLICNLEYFAINANEAYSGIICLQGFLDKWHNAVLSFEGCSHYRKSIDNTQFINFRIKTSRPGEKVFMSIYAWHSPENTESRSIEISQFIGSQAITEEYQEVSIPIDSFKTNDFTASWIENLQFKGDEPETMFNIYIDDLILIDTTKAEVIEVAILSNRSLELRFDGRYDPEWAVDISKFYIVSTDDTDFDSPIYPSKAGIRYNYDGLVNDTLWLALPTSKYSQYLSFDNDLKQENRYSLHVLSNDTSSTVEYELNFTYSDLVVNGSVKINQLGYLPENRKYAYVGNYLGTAGMMSIKDGAFEIRSVANEAVKYSGTLSFRADDLELSGEQVFECDFSEFTQVGSYYIYVPNVGRSYDFEINANVFDEALKVAAKGLFLQRCGIELSEENAGDYAHPACHLNDAKVHYSIANIETYGNELINSKLDVTGGWHDAGDYSRPLSNQIVVVSDLLLAYEMFPEKFGDDWNITESGNGIADVLDEAKWGLDYMHKMQSEDGGVFYKVATKSYPAVMPQNDAEQYYVSAKTTHITAMYAAVMANASRIFSECKPDFADLCLEKAIKAWEFIEMFENAVPDFGYVDELLESDLTCGETPDDGDRDERAWAAIELYKATGDLQYHTNFLTYWNENDPFFGWSRQAHSQKRASRSYLDIHNLQADEGIRTTILEAINSDAQELSNLTTSNPYRGGYRSDYRPYIGWGNYSQSTNQAATLIKAFYFTDESEYLQAAGLNMDPQFGNNPLSKCFVTGLGANPVMNPIHYPSELDGHDLPIPGIPVYGAHHNEEWQYRDFIHPDVTFPPFYNEETQESEYPTLRRYFDEQRVFSMNEFTIAENMSHLIFSLAYFSGNDVEAGCNISKAKDVSTNPNAFVSPNPSIGRLQVVGNQNFEKLSVVNASGQLIYSSNFNKEAFLDAQTWNNGLYFITLKGKRSLTTLKFIKIGR